MLFKQKSSYRFKVLQTVGWHRECNSLRLRNKDNRRVNRFSYPPLKQTGLRSLVTLAAFWFGLLAPVAHGGEVARSTADGLMFAHAASMPPPEPQALGIDATAVDSRELSKQHGKGNVRPGATGTQNTAVILWDERGSQGGQTTRVSMTGTGNVQSSTVSLSLR